MTKKMIFAAVAIAMSFASLGAAKADDMHHDMMMKHHMMHHDMMMHHHMMMKHHMMMHHMMHHDM